MGAGKKEQKQTVITFEGSKHDAYVDIPRDQTATIHLLMLVRLE